MINKNHTYDIIKNIAFLLGCAIFFASCENASSEKRNTEKWTNIPTEVIKNAQIIKRDSGRISLKASAPLIEKFGMIDSPYTVARKGIHIEFYDKKNPKKPGIIDADSARFSETKKFYEAHGNVKIKTNEGKTFDMKSIYWNQKQRELYTQDTVYITYENGSKTMSTGGMVAKDDFSEFTFKNNSGGKLSKKDLPQ
ncbi:MAG: LPS export ABC transporter periplasmic protein LptC [Flavobacteriales bacterium]|nr:MAG: LPS export ABC transporter periplasmic protein LptC [Flavobacteriales bacterium]